MKKIKLCLCGLLVASTLAACSIKGDDTAAGNFEVIEKNGKSYISLGVNAQSQTESSANSCEAAFDLVFDSLGEMKSCFENQSFTQEQLEKMEEVAEDDGTVEMLDVSALKDLRCPDDYTVKVVWKGWQNYAFFTDIGVDTLYAEVISEEEFDQSVHQFQNFDTEMFGTCDSVTTDPDRNAKVYHYMNNADQPRRAHYYTIDSNGETRHIMEFYRLEESETIPASVKVLGEGDGCYFEVALMNNQERPSVEGLSQFDMVNYEG